MTDVDAEVVTEPGQEHGIEGCGHVPRIEMASCLVLVDIGGHDVMSGERHNGSGDTRRTRDELEPPRRWRIRSSGGGFAHVS